MNCHAPYNTLVVWTQSTRLRLKGDRRSLQHLWVSQLIMHPLHLLLDRSEVTRFGKTMNQPGSTDLLKYSLPLTNLPVSEDVGQGSRPRWFSKSISKKIATLCKDVAGCCSDPDRSDRRRFDLGCRDRRMLCELRSPEICTHPWTKTSQVSTLEISFYSLSAR